MSIHGEDAEMEKSRIFRKETESIILFTSTADFEFLYRYLTDQKNTCRIVIPENRLGTPKIQAIQDFCVCSRIEMMVHPKGGTNLEAFHEWIRKSGAAIAVSWNYSQILRKETLDLFPKGVWNMHGGKIPEYRGGNVLQWAIVNGETEAGVTWHLMDEKVDHGQILKQGTVPILENDTAIEVFAKISRKGLELFRQLWDEAVTDGIQPYDVDMTAGHYWKARMPLDGIIRSEMTGREIWNLLRAQCPPWPAPILVHENTVYRVHRIADERGEGMLEYDSGSGKIFLEVSRETDRELVRKILERIVAPI